MKWVIFEKCFSLTFIVFVFFVDQCLGAQYNTFPSKRAAFCPPNTACQPLSTCPILSNILSNECVLRNQIDNLSCGYQGSGLVCCPGTSGTDRTFNDRSFNDRSFNDRSYTPGKPVDGLSCGVSQILGDNYNGIGAYPWAARVAFKNFIINEIGAHHFQIIQTLKYSDSNIQSLGTPCCHSLDWKSPTINCLTLTSYYLPTSVLTGETKFPCGGSIINNRVILTAAHCALAKAENFKLYMVRVGEYSMSSQIDCGSEFCGLPVQDIPISHVVVHPGYDKQTFKDNIALIVLRNKINYTVTAQPICLPESWSVTSNNGVLVGWGKTAGQTEASPQQQVLRLPIVSTSKCYSVYGKTLPVTDDHLCAGGDFGNDACSGFGGSPLLVQQGSTFYQVGILSFGSDQCGAGGVPSVYTNVKKYVDWIKENTPLIYNN